MTGIDVKVGKRCRNRTVGFFKLNRGAVKGFDNRFKPPVCFFKFTFKATLRTAKGTFGPFATRKLAAGIIKGGHQLFAMHQELSFFGKTFFFAFFRAKLFKLVNCVAQPFFFFAGFVDARTCSVQFFLRVAPGAPVIAHRKGFVAKVAMGIKRGPVCCRIQQAMLIKLPLNFDAVIANFAQKSD